MWLVILKVVAVLAGLFVYGTAVEPRFVAVDRISGKVPHLPAAWEGKQIAVFADLQVGMWWANTDAESPGGSGTSSPSIPPRSSWLAISSMMRTRASTRR